MTKSTLNSDYKAARNRLKSTIKTGEKYNLKTVSLPDKPKRITQNSINRLNKLNEQQKKINVIRPRYKTVTLKYYYKDASGKNVAIASQDITLDKASRFKSHRVQIKNYHSFIKFINENKNQSTMSKLNDIERMIKASEYETGLLTMGADLNTKSLGKILNTEKSLLGEDSTRMGDQRRDIEDVIERLKYAIGSSKIDDEVQTMVDHVLEDYEEARTYYKTDNEMKELIKRMTDTIYDIDEHINGLTSVPFEERYKADVFDALKRQGSNLNA